MEWWVNGIGWIMDKIIETYKVNQKDGIFSQELKDFWMHIFKYYYGGGSGVNPSIDGWIVNFFPYIDEKPSSWAERSYDKIKEECAAGDKDDEKGSDDEDGDEEDWFLDVDLTQPGLDIEKLKKAASGINTTPYVWSCGEGEIKMKLISGFAGAKMTKDGFVRAQMGWAVAEDKPEE